MKVLGLDPGYGRLGWGVVEQSGFAMKAVEFGVFETASSLPFPARLEELHAFVSSLAARHRCGEAAVEQIFFSKNVKTAVLVAEARGVILLALRQAGLEAVEVSPQHVKQALVGQGAATKAQNQFMVQRLLGLKSLPKPDDAADALGLAVAALRSRPMRLLARQAAAKAVRTRTGGGKA